MIDEMQLEAVGTLTREVPESGVEREVRIGRPARLDTCDHLLLERGNDRGDAYVVLDASGCRLGAVEPAGPASVALDAESWSIRPCVGESVDVVRRSTLLGERLEVRGASGPIARVDWLALRRGYHYRVRIPGTRDLRVDGRYAGDFELDIVEGGRRIGAIEFDLHAAPAAARDTTSREKRVLPIRQRRICVEPGTLTPSQRWGLLAAALFAEHPPRLFGGRFGRKLRR